MEHSFCAEFEDVLLRPLHRYDIEYLRQWRNNGELNNFLRNVGKITREQQENWFNSYIKDTDVLFFAVDFKRKRTVGSLALYDFHENSCQIGKIVIGENDARGKGLGRMALLMAMCIGVNDLEITEFKLSVHEKNFVAKRIYEKIGFEKIGSHLFASGGEEDEMKISKSVLGIKNNEVNEIFLFKENDVVVKKSRII